MEAEFLCANVFYPLMDEQKTTKGDQYIDVKQVFYKKNPRLAKILPGFVFTFIKRIIHQDEMNEAMAKYGHFQGLEFINKALDYLGLHVKTLGLENIPGDGRYIFVANHPLGGLDGIAFANEVGKKFPDIRFIVNDILMNIKNFDPIFIPVNKHGRQSVDYVRKIEETYESDVQILNFPAGLCSRKINGRIVDLEWHKSFITKAIRHKRRVVPVHINGRNSNFFYNLAKIRSFLGIKANIEMFFLPDEMFKQKNKDLIIRFGEPIPYQTFDSSKKPSEWARWVKEKVYSMGEEITK